MKYTRGYWKGFTPDGRRFKTATRERAEKLAEITMHKDVESDDLWEGPETNSEDEEETSEDN